MTDEDIEKKEEKKDERTGKEDAGGTPEKQSTKSKGEEQKEETEQKEKLDIKPEPKKTPKKKEEKEESFKCNCGGVFRCVTHKTKPVTVKGNPLLRCSKCFKQGVKK